MCCDTQRDEIYHDCHDLNEIFELDFHNMKKSENVTNYDKKIMTRFMSELVKYHFPDVKSFKVAKDLFN